MQHTFIRLYHGLGSFVPNTEIKTLTYYCQGFCVIMEEREGETMQESRLFKIIYHLLDKGQATAPELAEKFEVSVRTIYRDIDALSEAGIPVYTETGRNGGIRLMNHFVLERAIFSEEEKQEILAALQSLEAVKGMHGISTLNKLAGLLDAGTENWLEADFSRWGNCPNDNEKFETLKTAVIRRKCMRITYAGSGGSIGERTVQPLKLSYKSRAWYLKAFCTDKQDYRLFKLSRILKWKMLDDTFAPRKFPEEEEPEQVIYSAVKLCFPKEMAYRVYDEFDPSEVKETEKGDLLVTTRIPEGTWIISFLLSFGEKAEVVEPVSLKRVLAEQAKAIYEKNSYERTQ